jgi:serine/threonine protein kinase
VPEYTGKRAGNYTILQKLGDGGFATVFLAQHTVLEKKAAVKFLLEEWINEPDVVSRFFDEARTMERLKDHPTIVKIIDIADAEKCASEGLPPYFIMDYVDGASLEKKIQSDEGFTLDFIIATIRTALDALGHCHKLGVVHRDIKPSNILITSDGQVKLTDFGIAKAKLNTSKTGNGLTLGSTDYMSPEQALGKRDLDHRTDIYSLGVTLYEMVTGKLPFTGDNPNAVALMHIQQEPPPPIVVNDAVPPRLNDLILKAMAKKREDRFQNCEEMIAALDHLNEPDAPVEAEGKTLDLGDFASEMPEDGLKSDTDASVPDSKLSRVSTAIRDTIRSKQTVQTIRLVVASVALTMVFLGLFVGYQFYNRGFLVINVRPAGAEVEVNKLPVGSSPIELPLSPGAYMVVLRHEGFEPRSMQILLGKQQRLELKTQLVKIDPQILASFQDLIRGYDQAVASSRPKGALDRSGEAWDQIIAALKTHAYRADVHQAFVDHSQSRGLLERARTVYSEWQRESPEELMPWVFGARVKRALGDVKGALDDLTKAWFIDPNEILLLNALGAHFQAEKNVARARQYYEQSLILRPDQPEIRKRLDSL